jgi:hypothetical protein
MASRQQRRQKPRGSSPGGSASQSRRSTSQKKATPWYIQPWALGLVVVIVAAVVILFVFLANNNKPKTTAAPSNFGPVPSSVLTPLINPPAGTYAAVGTGGTSDPWSPLHGATGLGTSPPELLYYGAEFCPYCAFERWSTINALSRFGTFSQLSLMKSSSSDVYPSTNTFSFYKSSYSSPYLKFTPIEAEDRNQTLLQTPTAAQNTVVSSYNSGGYFPWMDLANLASTNSPGSAAGALHVSANDTGSAAMTWSQIANTLGTASSPQAQAIFGRANWLTAGICKATKNTPKSVCSVTPTPTLEKQLKF